MKVRSGLIAGLLAGAVIMVSSCGTSTPTETALPDSHQSYPEHLVLKGQLKGTLAGGGERARRPAFAAGP
jgi:hypothetical protein